MKNFISNIFIILGICFFIFGIIIKMFPNFGKLPGDITIKGKNYVIYIPIISSIILSIFITMVLNIILTLFKK
jgi:hypothetical protein